MPSLSEHNSSELTKLLLMGDSGSGKTGALVSLVKAGYKLRIIDLDSGLGILRTMILQQCPDKIENVDFETIRDKYKSVGTSGLKATPKAWTALSKLLNEWPDGTTPAEWGPDTILVIDSLTAAGKAALAWATGMNPAAKDRRQHYGAAQESIDNMLDMLTSDEFNTNLIIITHVKQLELESGIVKEVPTAIGSALSAQMGKYFNNIICCAKKGSGVNVKRTLRTVPSATMDLKASNPSIQAEYSQNEGLAELFELLQSTKG